MSWSWKKVKKGRLSQLLSDGISERRRKGAGSPLVVETGFPTSIIDLFVKNKDKLKNPLLKKKSKNDSRKFNKINISPDCVISSVQSPPPPPPPPPPSLSASPLNTSISNGDFGVSGMVVEDRSGGENEWVNGNHLLSATVSRIFLVVVLALGTKMFVAGITFSAFLLLLLEYLVKQQFIGPPCTESKEMINLMVTRVKGFLRIRKGNQDESNSSSKPVMKIEEKQGRMRDCRGGAEDTEIELNEIQCEKEKIDACDGKIEVVYIKDIIRSEAGEEFRTRKSRQAKMRVRMREFLPKTLRKKKTQNVDVGVENIGLIEEEEDQRVLGSNTGSSLSSISGDVDVDIVELSINQMEEETTPVIQHSSSSYVALVVIVLAGLLVDGRVLALILTVSWCLSLKLCIIGRRCIKKHPS